MPATNLDFSAMALWLDPAQVYESLWDYAPFHTGKDDHFHYVGPTDPALFREAADTWMLQALVMPC